MASSEMVQLEMQREKWVLIKEDISNQLLAQEAVLMKE